MFCYILILQCPKQNMAVNIPRESRSLSSLRLNASGVDGILLHQGEEFRLRILECAMRSGVDGVKFSIEADTDNRTSVTVQEARVIGLRIENGARCFSITENDVQIIRRSPAYFAPLPLEFRDLPGREYIVQGRLLEDAPMVWGGRDRIQFPKASSIPEICRNCKNLHGQAYTGKQGTNMLICAMHPSGAEGDECSDREENDTGIINQHLEEVAGAFGSYTVEIIPSGVWQLQSSEETEGDREEEEG